MKHDTYDRMHQMIRSYVAQALPQSEAQVQMWEVIKSDEACFQLLFDNWFIANWPFYIREEVGPEQVVVTRLLRQKPRRQQRLAKASISVVLLNLPLPDGTRLQDATFAQCKRAGGWFLLIAKHGKSNQLVRNKLSETDLANLWKRTHP